MRKVRIGMMVALPKKWDVEANWSTFETLIRRHAEDGVDVFITPECFLDGYAITQEDWTREKFAQVAQTLDDSRYVAGVKNLAAQTGAYIVFGFTERESDHFYNCALLVDRNGEIAGKYYKTHLQSHDLRFTPGEDLPVFELDFGVAGMVICADRRWPEWPGPAVPRSGHPPCPPPRSPRGPRPASGPLRGEHPGPARGRSRGGRR